MERSITSLAFKGSVTEAISESKRLKKLFVVYISDEDEISARMQSTTWIDDKVVESLPKYCILLHIPHGSTEAVQFSSIYPQKSVPCITVVGYTGFQMCQIEGFVPAEVLVSAIEEAWLSLHLQECLLSSALASNKSQPSCSKTSENAHQEDVCPPEVGPTTDSVDLEKESTASLLSAALASKISEPTSSGTSANSHLEDVPTPEAGPTSDSVDLDKESSNKCDMEHSTDSADTTQLDSNANMPIPSSSEIVEESSIPGDSLISSIVEEKCLLQRAQKVEIENHSSEDSIVEEKGLSQREQKVEVEKHTSKDSIAEEKYLPQGEQKVEVKNHTSKDSEGTLSVVSREPTGDANMGDDQKAAIPVSDDIFLNIKLPNGTNLQQKFTKTSSLSVVKACVAEHQEHSVVSYNLAIPYPRRVFFDQDLNKSLSELGLSNRQAMILVPHQKASGTTATTVATSNASDEGPNPGIQDNLRGASSGPSTPQGQNRPEGTSGNKRSRPLTNTRFGSNIHTLKHDEDDMQLGKRNPFWNGNSTQYNGNVDNDAK